MNQTEIKFFLGSTCQITTTPLFSNKVFEDVNKIVTTTLFPSKCSPNPCLNGAVCTTNNLTSSNYTCFCVSGFTG
jgi:hypothetical protein